MRSDDDDTDGESVTSTQSSRYDGPKKVRFKLDDFDEVFQAGQGDDDDEQSGEKTEQDVEDENASDPGNTGHLPCGALSHVKPFRPLHKRRQSRRKKAQESSPEYVAKQLALQFQTAQKQNRIDLLEPVIEKLKESREDDPLRRELPQGSLDKALLYSMISRNLLFSQRLIEGGASVKGADEIYVKATHEGGGMRNCDCGMHHGMLLIALTRQSATKLAEIAMRDLDINSWVCDGDTRRMWWQDRGIDREPILKSMHWKTSVLSAAISTNDLSVVQLVVKNGALLDAHDCIAFVAAAKLTADKKHRILRYLFQEMTNRANFASDPKQIAAFEKASAAALRSAAENGDTAKLHMVIDMLERTEEWAFGTSRNRPQFRPPILTAKQQQQQQLEHERGIRRGSSWGAAAGAAASSAALNSSPSRSSSFTTTASCSSSGSSLGSLNAQSMINYTATRSSLTGLKSDFPPGAADKNARGGGKRGSMPGQRTLVEKVLATAIQTLIEDGADPELNNRHGLNRALEGLSLLDPNQAAIVERQRDLFDVFLATLSSSGRSAESSALKLLDSCGLDAYLTKEEEAEYRKNNPLRRESKSSKKGSGKSPNPDDLLETSLPYSISLDKVFSSGDESKDSPRGGNGSSSQASPASPAGDSGSPLSAPAGSPPKPPKTTNLVWSTIKKATSKVLKRSSSTPGMTSGEAEAGSLNSRRASTADRLKALRLATQSGHAEVLGRLLVKVADQSKLRLVIPQLLIVAAQSNSIGVLPELLHYMGTFDEATRHQALSDAYMAALAAEDVEFAEDLIRKGAKPGREAQMKAIHLACQRKDPDTLDKLLLRIDDESFRASSIPALLAMVARCGDSASSGAEVVPVLVKFMGPRIQDELDSAFAVGLKCQNFEFCVELLDQGCRPTINSFVDALSTAVCNPMYSPRSLVKLFKFMEVTPTLGESFGERQVCMILDSATNTPTPNWRAVQGILALHDSYVGYVNAEHLMNLVRASSTNPENTDFQELLTLVLKCLEHNISDFDDVVQAACREAESRGDGGHSGVLRHIRIAAITEMSEMM